MVKRVYLLSSLCLAVAATIVFGNTANAHPEGMTYPVIGNTNYSDTFLAYRAGQVDNKHHAIDIFAPKHSPIVSPVNGTVRYVGYPQDSWGWYMVIVDDGGFEYHFMHINNDVPGTDNGEGGAMNAYAPYMKAGNRVVKGQHIAYVGDSGNAETTPPHLHFEIIKPEYTHMEYRQIPLEGFVNPFTYLNAAPHLANAADFPPVGKEVLPYGSRAAMNINVDRGELNTASAGDETVSGAGRGGGPHIKVFRNDGVFTGREFMAYDPYFAGGVDVAVGDIDGDGSNEIITGAGRGGGPHVKAFNSQGKVIASFYAYDYRFAGGIRVAAGDVDGDGKDEIITGIQGDGGPHVKVFRQNGQVVGQYFAYSPKFTGGIDVAAADVNNDGKAEIVTGAGRGGGPHIRVTDAQGKDLSAGGYYAYDYRFAGGVKVSAGEVIATNPGAEIVVAPWSGGGAHVKVFNQKGALLRERVLLEVWWSGWFDVAVGNSGGVLSTGVGRRASIHPLGF